MRKDEIRAVIRAKRKALTPGWIRERSELVQGVVMSLSEFREARTVCCYLALPGEVQTERIFGACWKAGKEVCVPAYGKEVDEYNLAWMKEGEKLIEGRWGVSEPADIVRAFMCEVDMIIVPGLAYDPAGNRVGYGRGYYDKMMSAETKTSLFKLGLAFEFQMFDSIPSNSRDVRLDGVATEQKVFRGGCVG